MLSETQKCLKLLKASRSDAAENEKDYYGAHFTYYGRICKSSSSWQVDVKMVLWDTLTFPSGFGRNLFTEYAAANDLETNHGWFGRSYVYAVWDDHFDSGRKP